MVGRKNYLGKGINMKKKRIKELAKEMACLAFCGKKPNKHSAGCPFYKS